MRWRFVDVIDGFDAWGSIRGRKYVSLEEYSLLEWWGRKGMLPAGLLVESCVQLARWLVMKSSDFQAGCLFSEADDLRFERVVGPGASLQIALTMTRRSDEDMHVLSEIASEEGKVFSGALRLSLLPLADLVDPGEVRYMWKELRGAA